MNLEKALVFCNAFKAEKEFLFRSVFPKAGMAKCGRQKRISRPEWLANKNKLKKVCRANIMDDILMGRVTLRLEPTKENDFVWSRIRLWKKKGYWNRLENYV